jgi:competence protein ComEA
MVIMKKSVVVVIVSMFAFTAVAASAAETEVESPAKAAMRKKIEQRERAERSGETEAESKLLDLNKATRPQLMSLPGIGAEEADRIIAGRPYQVKTQLRKKADLSAEVFYDIVEKVKITEEKPRPQTVVVTPPPVKKQDDGPVKDKFKAIKM